MSEEVLAGGNLNPVVRVGDTVRRVSGPWTPAVHQLLNYLAASDFGGAPRVLGYDDRGREILTFIDGMTDSFGDPGWIWSEAVLCNAALLIRRYHDLCRSFRPLGECHWQVMVGAPTAGDIICHNDLAPYNTVFQGGVPAALIDWDMAAPGPSVWDVAGAAWRFVPLYSDNTDRGWPAGIAERAFRLRLFCDAYGLPGTERARLVDMIERRIRCGLDTLEAWGRAGKPGWSQIWKEKVHGDGALRDLAYLRQNGAILRSALAGT